MLDRRRFLALACAGGALLIAPRLVFASVETDRRFIFIIQRGAADGLHIVSPYGDPDYAKMRGALAVDPATATKLDSSFALHPALTETAKMYNAGEALFVHAIASPYRERSHFDGQNVIETGGSAPYQVKDAWLNRLVALLPKRKAPPIALTPTVPMALRTGMGPAWMKTTVLVATEFGRTVAVNGTKGTDHGTATAAMLIGGAVQGGRVLTEWPGLSQAALYDNRDLKATMSLDAFIAGAVGESFVIDPALVARTVFKEGSGAKPMTGLLRS